MMRVARITLLVPFVAILAGCVGQNPTERPNLGYGLTSFRGHDKCIALKQNVNRASFQVRLVEKDGPSTGL